MHLAYITHPDCLKHKMGAMHPESPQRLVAIETALTNAKLIGLMDHIEAPLADPRNLLRVHSQAYIDTLFEQAPQAGWVSLDADTLMNPHTLNAALRAAGSVVHAVDLVMNNKYKVAFCAVRPPGHHAEREKAMGFCFFNNIAVGAAHALDHHGLSKITVIDFDVHHGNGTHNIFKDDTRVLICSSYQHPYYPFTESDDTNVHIVHTPLEAGTESTEFRKAFSKNLIPAIDKFSPECLFVSAGFDAHREDPLAELCLKTDDYRWLGKKIKSIADQHCEGKVIITLEGGYNLNVLGECVATFLSNFTS